MSWYSTGHEAAEQLAQSSGNRRRKNFYTKPGEGAVIRFLTPARASFNYKRGFVKWAKGEKMLTSPGSVPDPLVEAGISLQVAAGWWILDRRVLEFKDQQTGEDKKVGPRVLYFADGMRTRKQLIAFEREMLDSENEDRRENGQDELTLEEFNLTSYDIKASKDQKAPWNFVAKRPKALSKDDRELVEKALGNTPDTLYEIVVGEDGKIDFSGPFRELLAKELEPLPVPELRAILQVGGTQDSNGDTNDETSATYSYEANEEEEESAELFS